MAKERGGFINKLQSLLGQIVGSGLGRSGFLGRLRPLLRFRGSGFFRRRFFLGCSHELNLRPQFDVSHKNSAEQRAGGTQFPAGALEDLLKPENRAKLAAIIKGHVINGRVKAADVKPGKVMSLSGKNVEIAKKDGKVHFGNALVVATDLTAANGVIHEIDTVVIPE